MNKLLAALISSAVLVTAGQAFAQPAAGDTGMSKDQSSTSDQTTTPKKARKHKRVHKKSKAKAKTESEATKSMGNETDSSVQEKKNP
ncbi:MAG TPA: hypothetical protein VF801_15370 [Rhodocyclaceae bacterium]